jgi:hypothetical protein
MPTHSQSVIWRAITSWSGLAGEAGLAEPLLAGIAHQADGGVGPVADNGLPAFAEVGAHGRGDHVRDGFEEVAQGAGVVIEVGPPSASAAEYRVTNV